MKNALRVAGVVALIVFVFGPRAALAIQNPVFSVPELDPSQGAAGLALLGSTVAVVIERYRRRTK